MWLRPRMQQRDASWPICCLSVYRSFLIKIRYSKDYLGNANKNRTKHLLKLKITSTSYPPLPPPPFFFTTIFQPKAKFILNKKIPRKPLLFLRDLYHKHIQKKPKTYRTLRGKIRIEKKVGGEKGGSWKCKIWISICIFLVYLTLKIIVYYSFMDLFRINC